MFQPIQYSNNNNNNNNNNSHGAELNRIVKIEGNVPDWPNSSGFIRNGSPRAYQIQQMQQQQQQQQPIQQQQFQPLSQIQPINNYNGLPQSGSPRAYQIQPQQQQQYQSIPVVTANSFNPGGNLALDPRFGGMPPASIQQQPIQQYVTQQQQPIQQQFQPIQQQQFQPIQQQQFQPIQQQQQPIQQQQQFPRSMSPTLYQINSSVQQQPIQQQYQPIQQQQQQPIQQFPRSMSPTLYQMNSTAQVYDNNPIPRPGSPTLYQTQSIQPYQSQSIQPYQPFYNNNNPPISPRFGTGNSLASQISFLQPQQQPQNDLYGMNSNIGGGGGYYPGRNRTLSPYRYDRNYDRTIEEERYSNNNNNRNNYYNNNNNINNNNNPPPPRRNDEDYPPPRNPNSGRGLLEEQEARALQYRKMTGDPKYQTKEYDAVSVASYNSKGSRNTNTNYSNNYNNNSNNNYNNNNNNNYANNNNNNNNYAANNIAPIYNNDNSAYQPPQPPQQQQQQQQQQDGPKPYYIDEQVPQFNKPTGGNNTVPEGNCALCSKPVFNVEAISDKFRKKTWHKGCFKCAVCDRQLNTGNYKAPDGTEFDGKVYCQSHFDELNRNRAIYMEKQSSQSNINAGSGSTATRDLNSNVAALKSQKSSASISAASQPKAVAKQASTSVKKSLLESDFDDVPVANTATTSVKQPLVITVIEGKELPVQLLEKQDVCVEIKIGIVKKRTAVKADAKKAVKFNESLDFGTNIAASVSDMTVSLINTAEVAEGGKEETLCSASFSIKSGEQWFEMKPRGQIKLNVTGR